MLGVVPAQKGLESDEFRRRDLHLRMVEQFELIFRDSHPQLLGQSPPAADCQVHVGLKEASAAAPVTFGAIKCHVGVGEELFRGGAVIGIEGYADAYPNIGSGSVDLEGSSERLELTCLRAPRLSSGWSPSLWRITNSSPPTRAANSPWLNDCTHPVRGQAEHLVAYAP